MSLPDKEVKCRLSPDLHAAFVEACEGHGFGLAEKGEALIEEWVKRELHAYMLAKQRYEKLGYLRNLRELAGNSEKHEFPYCNSSFLFNRT